MSYLFGIIGAFFLAALAMASLPERATEILTAIKTPRDLDVAFTETRMNKLLAEPLVLRGTVSFSSEGELSKRINDPFSESVSISVDTVEFERNGKSRRIALSKNSELALFSLGLRALMLGDANTLEKLFEVTVVDGGDQWTLVLRPADPDLAKLLDKLVVEGAFAKVHTVETWLTPDNWQRMEFGHPDQPAQQPSDR